ncbi:uncharacterized protein OCT59_024831 [Rhizophagus irregularis]|nr:hypothetical protein OCT59_024831 [Rhizophagus irregularis]
MRKSLISTGRAQSIIITSARACTSDAQVVFSSNVVEIIFFRALSFRNYHQSLLRWDVVATGLGVVKALAIAFTSFSPKLSQTIRWAILLMVFLSGMILDIWHILTSPASSPPSLGITQLLLQQIL